MSDNLSGGNCMFKLTEDNKILINAFSYYINGEYENTLKVLYLENEIAFSLYLIADSLRNLRSYEMASDYYLKSALLGMDEVFFSYVSVCCNELADYCCAADTLKKIFEERKSATAGCALSWLYIFHGDKLQNPPLASEINDLLQTSWRVRKESETLDLAQHMAYLYKFLLNKINKDSAEYNLYMSHEAYFLNLLNLFGNTTSKGSYNFMLFDVLEDFSGEDQQEIFNEIVTHYNEQTLNILSILLINEDIENAKYNGTIRRLLYRGFKAKDRTSTGLYIFVFGQEKLRNDPDYASKTYSILDRNKPLLPDSLIDVYYNIVQQLDPRIVDALKA